MITAMAAKGFTGVAYLEGSALMQRHKGSLSFSTVKPNVVVGPNGSGKSALMQTLAIRFLAHFTGKSTFDDKYVTSTESKDWWTKVRQWGDDYTWLSGLNCKTDNGPVLYYRPGHVPGNEVSVTHAMLTGYPDESRDYARMVEHKSSGEQSRALLAAIGEALSGKGAPSKYLRKNWRYGDKAIDLSASRARMGYVGSYDYQAETLKALYTPNADAMPVLMMDEPEASLDAMAEAELWSKIANANCERVQVIVATHSLYPMMHRDRFHIIECKAGYVDDVLALMG